LNTPLTEPTHSSGNDLNALLFIVAGTEANLRYPELDPMVGLSFYSLLGPK
jgi:hypothetical protein